MANTIKGIVCKVLNDSQDSTFLSDDGIKQLKLLFDERKNDSGKLFLRIMDFVNEFNECIKAVLTAPDLASTYYVKEFVIDFIASLNGESENENNIQHDIVDGLLKNSRANSDTVRLRICQILHGFLKIINRTDQGRLDESLIKKMQKCLIERNRDANITVQKESLLVSSFLQFPRDKYCPIVSSFVHLLKHDSMVEIKVLIMSHIVINQLTFSLIKTLMYDTNPVISNKALELIEKKVPNKFLDAQLKKKICTRLLQTNSKALLELFIIKWQTTETQVDIADNKQTNDPTLRFIQELDLENVWFFQTALNHSDMSHMDASLQKIMDIVYIAEKKNKTKRKPLVSSTAMEKIIKSENFQSSLNEAVRLRTLMDFQSRHSINKLDFVNDLNHLKLQADQFKTKLFGSFKFTLNASSTSILTAFNFMRCLFYLSDFKVLHDSYLIELIEWLFNMKYTPEQHCLYELLVTRLDKKKLKKLVEKVWEVLSKDIKEVEKFLVIFSLYLAKLSNEDYLDMEQMVLNMSLNNKEDNKENLNFIEFLVKNFVLKHISNVDPNIRALCVRTLGLVSLINTKFVEKYVHLFNQITCLDCPQVVIESLKALFNIILTYPGLDEKWDKKDTWDIMFKSLEKQMDCSSDKNVRFIAFEGFAKLLLNKCWIPNSHVIFSKLIITYISEVEPETTSQKQQTQQEDHIQLKPCLSTFFRVYIEQNKEKLDDLVQFSFMPTLKYAVNKNSSGFNKRKISDFIYYLTFNTKRGIRQLLMTKILEEIYKDLNEFKLINRWIEVLLEFNVHQLDIDQDNLKELDSLNKIVSQMTQILAHFKQEKWRLAQEEELKNLISSLRLLIRRNEEFVKRKNPNVDPYFQFNEEDDDDVQTDVEPLDENNNRPSKSPNTRTVPNVKDMLKKNRLR